MVPFLFRLQSRPIMYEINYDGRTSYVAAIEPLPHEVQVGALRDGDVHLFVCLSASLSSETHT